MKHVMRILLLALGSSPFVGSYAHIMSDGGYDIYNPNGYTAESQLAPAKNCTVSFPKSIAGELVHLPYLGLDGTVACTVNYTLYKNGKKVGFCMISASQGSTILEIWTPDNMCYLQTGQVVAFGPKPSSLK